MENRTRHTSIHFQINSADIDCDVNDVDIKVPDYALLTPDQNLLCSPKKETDKARYSSEISELNTGHIQTFLERAHMISNE